MSQNKKYIIIFAVIFGIIVLFELYKKQITTYYFDTFHKRLCTDSFCINKPKGWIPWFVKRDGTDYVLNLLPKKVLFWVEFEEHNNSKYLNTEIVLSKNDQHIVIYSHTSIDEGKFKKFKKLDIANLRCYQYMAFSLACFGNININISYDGAEIETIRTIEVSRYLKTP